MSISSLKSRAVRLALAVWFLLPLSVGSASAQPVVFDHFAGTTGGAGNRDGVAMESRFASPSAVAIFNDTIYVADAGAHTIRRISSTGYVTTLAGLAWQPGDADGAGAVARFNRPSGLAVDVAGNLYVSDTGNRVIRKITPAGVVTTIAGKSGYQGHVDGPSSEARFDTPTWITADSTGDLFVSDENLYAQGSIRRISASGQVSTLVSNLYVGGVSSPPGSESFFYADRGNSKVYRASFDGSGYVFELVYAASAGDDFSYPRAIAATSLTEVYVSDGLRIGHFVRDPIAGWQNIPHTPDFSDESFISGIALDSHNDVIAASHGVNVISKRSLVAGAWVISLLAGKPQEEGSGDGNGANAGFTTPRWLAIDSEQNVFVADLFGLKKITPAGDVSTLYWGTVRALDQANGTTYYSTGSAIMSRSSAGAVTPIASGFGSIGGIEVASPSLIYVSDTSRSTIEKLTLVGGTWTVTRIAGAEGTCSYQDGPGTQARFCYPEGITLDQAGNLFVADRYNYSVRKITPAGEVSTAAGRESNSPRWWLQWPTDVAIDQSGNLLIVDSSGEIVRVTPGGEIATIAGVRSVYASTDGQGSGALFNQPNAIDVSSTGEIFIADTNNHCIRRGRLALPDTATVDQSSVTIGQTIQLGVAQKTGTTFRWYMKRQPSPSTATLSLLNVFNPTFAPDVAGRYEFEVHAATATGLSITSVVVDALCSEPPGAPAISRIDGPATSCVGESVTLQAVASGAAAIAWSTGTSTPTVTVAPSETTTYTLTAFDENGCSSEATYTQVVDACVMTPRFFNFSVQLPTTVNLYWSAVPGATYEVARTTDGSHWDTFVTADTYLIDPVAARPYLYKLRAVHPSAGASPYTSTRFVSLKVFATSIYAGTRIRGADLSELRTAVNELRSLAALPLANFTDPVIDATVPVKGVHLTELRTAVAEARAALGLSSSFFTDPNLNPGISRIRASHFLELRDAVK